MRKTTLGLLACLVFFAPLIFIPGLSDYTNLPQAAFLQVGCCVVFLFWMLAFLFRSPHQFFIWSMTDILVFFLIIWSGLSLWWTPSLYSGLYIWSQWLAAAGLYLVARQFIQMRRALKIFLLLFFVSGVIVALIGIIQFLLPSFVQWIPEMTSYSSTFGSKSMAIQYLLLTLPLGWILFLLETRLLKGWLLGLGITLMGIYLSYALSRSGLLFSSIQAVILMGFLVSKKWRSILLPDGWNRQKTAMVLACFSLFFVFANLTRNGFQWRWEALETRIEQAQLELSQDENKKESGGRIVLIKNTWEMVKDDPWIGRGINSFKIFYPLYSRSSVPDSNFTIFEQPAQAHNDYIQTWAEQGLVGLLLMLGLFAVFIVMAWRGAIALQKISPLYLGMMLGGMGMMFDALVSFPMTRAIPIFVLFFYLSMMMGNSESSSSPKTNSLILPRWLAIFFVLLIAVILGQVTSWNYRRLAGERHYRTAVLAGEDKNWPKGLSEAQIAYRFSPTNHRIVFLVARFYMENGQNEKAIATFLEGLRENPNSANDIWTLGSAYLRTGNLGQALFHYQKAVSLMPSVALFHFQIAAIYKKQGEEQKALAEYRKAFELDPSLF